MDAVTIIHDLPKIIAAIKSIQEAVEIYEQASKKAKAAGDELAANWEGDAQKAFVEEQNKAASWYLEIASIVKTFAKTLEAACDKKRQMEQMASDLFKS